MKNILKKVKSKLRLLVGVEDQILLAWRNETNSKKKKILEKKAIQISKRLEAIQDQCDKVFPRK